MHAIARLEELATHYGLPPDAPARLMRILELLVDDPASLTTVRAPDAAVDVHVADSLVGLQVEAIQQAVAIADLGAGAGFPGLVLALARPEASVRLVESVGKKCAFIARAAEAAELPNVEVVHARAEDWPAGIGAHDVVTARALAPLGVLCEYAAPLLSEGGVMVAWKGRPDSAETADAEVAAEALGLDLTEVRPVSPYPGVDHRALYLYSKVRATPDRFPRRPGMARKRPLQASGRA